MIEKKEGQIVEKAAKPKNLNEIAQTLDDMKDEECANKLKVLNLAT